MESSLQDAKVAISIFFFSSIFPTSHYFKIYILRFLLQMVHNTGNIISKKRKF